MTTAQDTTRRVVVRFDAQPTPHPELDISGQLDRAISAESEEYLRKRGILEPARRQAILAYRDAEPFDLPEPAASEAQGGDHPRIDWAAVALWCVGAAIVVSAWAAIVAIAQWAWAPIRH